MKYSLLICPVGKQGTTIRNRADFIENLVKASFNTLQGFEESLQRADKVSSSGRRVFDKIIEEILKCDLLVADTTDNNPNVMLELGVALILGKPLVLLRVPKIKDDEPIPFDIQDFQFVDIPRHLVDYKNNYERLQKDIEKAQLAICKEARSVLSKQSEYTKGLLTDRARILLESAFQPEGIDDLEGIKNENERLRGQIQKLDQQLDLDEERKVSNYVRKLRDDIGHGVSSGFIIDCYEFGDRLESQSENYTLALKLYEVLMDHDEENEAIYYRLARVLHSLWLLPGKHTDSQNLINARSYCEQALSLNADFEEAKHLMMKIENDISILNTK